MFQSQLSIDFQHTQFSSISQLLLANTPHTTGANLRLKGKRTLKAASSKTNLVGFFFRLFFYFCTSQVSLLAEVSHDEAKMRERRETCLSPFSFLPRHERPLLAGKSQVNLLISFTGKKVTSPITNELCVSETRTHL